MTALFPVMNSDQMLEEITAYSRHVRGDYDYTIQVEPRPTPRPRSRIMSSRKGQPCQPYVMVYPDKAYMDYKDEIISSLKDAKLGLKKGEYSSIHATLYFPYPASTPKKLLIEGAKHRKRPDWDNCAKGFLDAIEQSEIIKGDGQISDAAILKRYTTKPQGFISFNLIV